MGNSRAADEIIEAMRSGGAKALARELDRSAAGLDAPGSGGDTPLIWAIKRGGAALAEALLEAGADPNARAAGGDATALHWAERMGEEDLGRKLLERGASASARGPEGMTPLLAACQRSGAERWIEMLLAFGARASEESDSGWGALHFAARNNDEMAVRRLLGAGADSSRRATAHLYDEETGEDKKKGMTPLQVARHFGAERALPALRAARERERLERAAGGASAGRRRPGLLAGEGA